MSPKIKLCKEEDCSNQQTTLGYCRLHYLKNWRTIRTVKQQKNSKELNRYVDNILKRNPDKGVQALKENLKDEYQFEQSINEYLYEDDLNTVLQDLGYNKDLDELFDNIKIDDSF